jgi:hypothetical protein
LLKELLIADGEEVHDCRLEDGLFTVVDKDSLWSS